jgi:hypothetical protein
MALNLKNFYIIVSPEQDFAGNIIVNRKYNKLRNWYFCSQEFDENNELDRQVLEIANVARIEALTDAFAECGNEGNFQLAKPKSCNEKAARRYMTGKIVIVLDNFDLTESICQINGGLLCKSIDDDPRVWRKIKWGGKKRQFKSHKKRYKSKNPGMGTISDSVPDSIKDNLKASSK